MTGEAEGAVDDDVAGLGIEGGEDLMEEDGNVAGLAFHSL